MRAAQDDSGEEADQSGTDNTETMEGTDEDRDKDGEEEENSSGLGRPRKRARFPNDGYDPAHEGPIFLPSPAASPTHQQHPNSDPGSEGDGMDHSRIQFDQSQSPSQSSSHDSDSSLDSPTIPTSQIESVRLTQQFIKLISNVKLDEDKLEA
ncbi:hypothetical protein VKT23_015097 [Stygiomarasmius scandens]|uniref:Uncharacterized protein n=1 Tax=Marasmiellus scandens TaxID=2682957 RepID=A0ABR1IYI2_9AGAR